MPTTEDSSSQIYLSADDLRDWTTSVLTRFGYELAAAEATARMLVEADLRGINSHSVAVMLPRYLILVERGLINKGTQVKVLRETANTVLLDAQNNMGAVVAEKAVELLVAKAHQASVAWAAIRNSNHIGVLGSWCDRIVGQEMIGLLTTNAGPDLSVHGSLGKRIGTNPICLGAPGPEFPVIVDIASSTTAMGKIRAAALNGEKIPTTWGMDESGQPTEDPNKVLEAGALLPLGGHKGTGLAILVDILCGILSGANCSIDMQPISKANEPLNSGQFMGAIRVDAFCPHDIFHQRMQAMIDQIHAMPRLPQVERIYLPGERSFETARQRRTEGIPISAQMRTRLEELARDYGVALPEFTFRPAQV